MHRAPPLMPADVDAGHPPALYEIVINDATIEKSALPAHLIDLLHHAHCQHQRTDSDLIMESSPPVNSDHVTHPLPR